METSELCVLVLDDDERVRISLETFFADEGFRTQSASSGEEALEVLKAYAADVVIVDIRLPGMDGDRFMREAHRLYPELKFLVHTGSADYCLPQHMIEAGVVGDHVHRKPLIDMSTLTRGVMHVVKELRTQSNAD